MSPRPRLLILSFSPIIGDARVLKQVARFHEEYDVTTCGYGEAPAGVQRHVRIPDGVRADDLNGRLITLRWYSRAYWTLGAVRWAREALEPGAWDLVLANDVEAVPVALGLRPRFGVHADLHEYSPRLHDEIPAWSRRITPYAEWLCRRYVARADSWTTVSGGLAREYERRFGFRPELVTNASPYADLDVTPAHEPLRLVHSGAGLRNRELMGMIEAVALTSASVTLDLFLTPNHPAYLDELRARAAEVPGVTVQDPVPYRQLIERLHEYDVGVMVLPPVNFSYRWALPNKIFDYVQARLGVVVGPSPEMAELVTAHGLGRVADGFAPRDLADVLDTLTPDAVRGYAEAADAAARELSAETQVEIWARALAALVARGEA